MTTDKARKLAQQIETSVKTLATETDAARRSDVFRGWLNAMAQFHSYSWNNQLLIAMQCPTATRVAGFHTWRKMNRFVRKGEKGITILAPCIYKPKKHDEQQGEEIEPQTHAIGTLRGFRAATVFDVSEYRRSASSPLCRGRLREIARNYCSMLNAHAASLESSLSTRPSTRRRRLQPRRQNPNQSRRSAIATA